MKYRSIENKSLITELNKIISTIEDKSYLLGVTGLEDKLQDDVENVIHDLLNAGISVWMLTGDKLDTAESIGFSCKLFNEDTEVFKIRAGSQEEVFENLKRTLADMEKLEHELMNFKIERTKNEIVKEAFKIETDKINYVRKESDRILKEVSQNGNENKHKEIEFGKINQGDGGLDRGKTVSPDYIQNNNQNLNDNQSQKSQKSQKNIDNDVAILHFIMHQKKDDLKAANLVEPDREKDESVSIFNRIIDEHEYELQNNKNGNKNGVVTNNVQPKNNNGAILFEINRVYDKYQGEIQEIEDKKKGLINKMEIVDEKKQLEKDLEMKSSLLINFGLIIEGQAISHFVHPDLEKYSWQLVQKCRSIICCRCNPLQKSEVVRFVKQHTDEIVLSIGDGGNDVNMIKVKKLNFN